MARESLGNSKETVELSTRELRSALQSILGFTQLLALTGDNLSAAQLRYLASIESAAGQLLGHTSGQLRPARLVFERVAITVDAAIVAAVARLGPLADAKGVRLDSERSGLAVLGDREQFEQMLHHLLGCAVRSTPSGGTVHVRVRRVGDGVRLSITDTGIGIPREITAARRLAAMMGGELEWEAEGEDRTGITVLLPAPQA